MRRTLPALAAALVLVACAPDSFRRSPAFNDFLGQISRECHPHTIGNIQLSTLISDPFFVNQTSNLFHKNLAPREYVSAVNAFYRGNNAAALDCILERAPR
jgi:hypothetical protein